MDPHLILLVEDNADDAALITRVLRDFGPGYRLTRTADGAAAIQYLKGVGAFAERKLFPLPKMILLDLSMPEVDGFQFLEWMRGQPSLGSIPVVVLTSSHHSVDIARAYKLGAASFVTKPQDAETLKKELRMALSYWAPIAGASGGSAPNQRPQP